MLKLEVDFLQFSLRRMGLVSFFAAAWFTRLFAQDVPVISNGGFELPQLTSQSGQTFSEGSSNVLPGWTILSSLVVLDNNPSGAYQGNQYVIFSAGGMNFLGVMSQTFPTTSGQSYPLSFAVGGAFDAARGATLGVTVSSGDGSILSSSNCVPIDGWIVYQMSFIATTTNTTLTFASTGGAATLELDDVVVSPPRPTLSISKGSDGVILSWPTASESFQLETTPSLDTKWVVFPGTLVTNSGSVTVTAPMSPTNGFFRLEMQ